MAYTKNTWVDQDVERPKTYEVTNNQDGSITLTDSFGLVTELGTPVNATNMNHIEDGIANCADIDLSNLSNEGEKHFLGKNQITNCILEAPNGVLETTSTTYTLKAGVKLLIPDGRNSDGTLKNIEHTVTEDISQSLPSNISFNFGYVAYNFITNGINFVFEGHSLYGLEENIPSTVSDTLVHWYYAIDTNKWYVTSGSTTADWVYMPSVIVSTLYFSNNTIQSAKDTEVLQIATKNQLSGHWTNKGLTLAEGTQINAETTKTFDLTDYLPKYGEQYEVIVAVRGYTQNNTMLDYVAYSDIITNPIMLCRAFARGNIGTFDTSGCATVPVGNKRKLYIRNTSQSASAFNGFNAYVCGYRRLG